MDRPALQRLLVDTDAGKVDCVSDSTCRGQPRGRSSVGQFACWDSAHPGLLKTSITTSAVDVMIHARQRANRRSDTPAHGARSVTGPNRPAGRNGESALNLVMFVRV
jgi:hypothetical protein